METRTYEERVAAIQAAANNQEQDFVPVISNFAAWAAGYKKVKLADLHASEDLFVKTMSSIFDDVYADAHGGIGLGAHIPFFDILGCDVWRISPDGYMIQHHEGMWMEAEEYPALIADPRSFILNVIAPRKFKALNGDRETVKKKLIAAMKELDSSNPRNRILNQLLKDKYGMVQFIGGGTMMSPFDIVFDRLRGFANTMVDIRRHPDQLKAAVDAIAPMYQKPLENLSATFPFASATPHAPTYLGRKNFEKFYWPSYEKMMQTIASQGCKIRIFFEGDWTAFYDLMLSIPANTIIAHLEEVDLLEAKKIFGGKMAIMSGIYLEDIKFLSKNEMFDKAKRLIDNLAPGGGFLWTTDKSVLNIADVNTENYIALQQFVHEYGKK